jgi:hypothetical protein
MREVTAGASSTSVGLKRRWAAETGDSDPPPVMTNPSELVSLFGTNWNQIAEGRGCK